jgi:glycosyltransferase involved in cell wall biosynthesis
MTEPAVSVVLPCYNAHHFLDETLDSVRAQTFRDLEIIVVDDGSTDPATRAFLDGLPADIRLIRQENRGLAGARNTGFRAAQGRLVLPLDCDDRIAPTMIERCVAALDAHNADFATAQMMLAGDETGVVRKRFNGFEQLATNQLPYCLLMRREAWLAVGGYDEAMRTGYEDWDLNIRLCAAGLRGFVLPEPLFIYRVRASGMLRSISQRQHAQIWRYIRTKNAATYRLPALLRQWRDWRRHPSTHPLWVVWVLIGLAGLLPDRGFNRLFFMLHRRGRSAREA